MADEWRTCPHCQAVIPVEAAFCGHCGRQISRRSLAILWPIAGALIVVVGILFSEYRPQAVPRPGPVNNPTVSLSVSAGDPPETPSTPTTPAPQPRVEGVTRPPMPTRTRVPTPLAMATKSPAATTVLTHLPRAISTLDRGPEILTIGHSVQNRPIQAIRFSSGAAKFIFIGGLHAGFAPSSVALAEQAINYYTDHLTAVPDTVTLYIIPNANPDALYAPGELAGRLNHNGVDINRNWGCNWTQNALFHNQVVRGSGGPNPFSEPETRALRDFILAVEPAGVVFWEARARDGLSSPGRCSVQPKVSVPLATTYAIAAGYPMQEFENLTDQVLNGDGTNWLDSQNIPAIAVLLPDYSSFNWEDDLAGLQAILDSVK